MRVLGGLGRMVIAALLAGVLVAGLLLPYAVGLGLASNQVTDAIANTPVSDFNQPPPERTTVTDDTGSTIAFVYTQNRVVVSLADISPYLQTAVVATEDRRFYQHKGVDWRGTVRALLKNSQGDTSQQGGSTLTQQYVKNYRFLVEAKTDAEKAAATASTPLRKLQEAKMALTLELPGRLSKDDIMERYLNLVAFGPSVYGAQAAAQYFFGPTVTAKNLSIGQAALLAAMVNNPNKYNPFNPDHRADALKRRNVVLGLMLKSPVNPITQAQYDAAIKTGLPDSQNATPNGCLSAPKSADYGYFCQYVLDYLGQSQGLTADQIGAGGLTIKTTLDPVAMKAAKTAVNQEASPTTPADNRVANVLAIVQPGSGIRKVLALAANRPYGLDKAKGQTVQRLTTTFAPLGAGSTFKIFTAAEALKEGLGTDSVVSNPPEYASSLVPAHKFHNSGSFPDKMTITQALATSPNNAFVKLEDQIGLDKVVSMAVALGMRGYSLDAGDVDRSFTGSGKTYAQEVVAQKIASFTLGVSPVSPIELSNVGATLASDGVWCQPAPVDVITDRDGQIVPLKETPCEQAVDKDLARSLTAAMQQDMHNAVGANGGNGTAYQAAQAAGWTRVAASKTGTTEDYKSSAFLGFTPYYSGAVVTWDYLDRPQSICVDAKGALAGTCRVDTASGTRLSGAGVRGMSGGSVPAATWFDAMTSLHAGKFDSQFNPSSNPNYLTGSPSSVVPSVVNQNVEVAKSELTAKGFQVVVVPIASGAAPNTVVAQDPTGLSSALPGTTVTINTSNAVGGG